MQSCEGFDGRTPLHKDLEPSFELSPWLPRTRPCTICRRAVDRRRFPRHWDFELQFYVPFEAIPMFPIRTGLLGSLRASAAELRVPFA
jgi:hypothetical protein